MPTPPYRPGDRVLCLDAHHGAWFLVPGRVYTVDAVATDDRGTLRLGLAGMARMWSARRFCPATQETTMTNDAKAYARSLRAADRKTALENLRLIDGCKVRVYETHCGVMAVVVNPDGTEGSSTGWEGSYDGAAEMLRRMGYVEGCPVHPELLP